MNISSDKYFSAPFTADIRRHLLELAGSALLLYLYSLLCDLVLVQSAGVSPSSQDQFRICLLRPHNLFLDILVDWGLDCAHESSTHINSLSTETQRRSKALTVREATGCNKGDFQGLPSPAQQDEVGYI